MAPWAIRFHILVIVPDCQLMCSKAESAGRWRSREKVCCRCVVDDAWRSWRTAYIAQAMDTPTQKTACSCKSSCSPYHAQFWGEKWVSVLCLLPHGRSIHCECASSSCTHMPGLLFHVPTNLPTTKWFSQRHIDFTQVGKMLVGRTDLHLVVIVNTGMVWIWDAVCCFPYCCNCLTNEHSSRSAFSHPDRGSVSLQSPPSCAQKPSRPGACGSRDIFHLGPFHCIKDTPNQKPPWPHMATSNLGNLPPCGENASLEYVEAQAWQPCIYTTQLCVKCPCNFNNGVKNGGGLHVEVRQNACFVGLHLFDA